MLDCIAAFIDEKGYGPTVREICSAMGLSSPSTVHVHLKALEDKGMIHRDPLKSRSINAHRSGASARGADNAAPLAASLQSIGAGGYD